MRSVLKKGPFVCALASGDRFGAVLDTVDSERTSGQCQSGAGLFNPTRRAEHFKDGERTLHQRSTFLGVCLELESSIGEQTLCKLGWRLDLAKDRKAALKLGPCRRVVTISLKSLRKRPMGGALFQSVSGLLG